MLPILLTSNAVRVGLAGIGEGHQRRAALLTEAGMTPVAVGTSGVLPDVKVLFISGLERDDAATLATRARDAGILVNVEDAPEFCDFHVPAIVRRGDLILTASTGGKSPGLARYLREWLENRFGPEWSMRLEDMSQARVVWRSKGLPPVEVERRTRGLISEKGWLE